MREEHSERPWLFQPGQVISGRYAIVRRLGYGGVGEVYEAEHVDLYSRVAIKVLHPKYLRTPALLQQMKNMMDREARLGAHIRRRFAHQPGVESIVQVFDSGITEGKDAEGRDAMPRLPFFAMELLEGHTLHAYIQHRRRLKDPIRIA